MSKKQITKEQARIFLENYLVKNAKEKASKLEIEDEQPGWVTLYGDFKDCFFVSMPDDNHTMIGASRIIAISKKTGEILTDSMCGE